MNTKVLTFYQNNAFLIGCLTIVPTIAFLSGHIVIASVGYILGYVITR